MSRSKRYAVWFFVVLLGTLITVFVAIERQTARYIYTTDSVPRANVAIVLGASVIGTSTLSVVLRERADTAIELYNKHKVAKILVSGDNSDVTHNEVDPVGKYLVSKGVPKTAIFLDHAGFDTYSSMYRASSVFLVESIIIVTQPFHLKRAIFIARQIGMDAYGVPASNSGSYIFNTLREIPATFKAVYDVMTRRQPKYTGPIYPVWGSSLPTWPGEVIY